MPPQQFKCHFASFTCLWLRGFYDKPVQLNGSSTESTLLFNHSVGFSRQLIEGRNGSPKSYTCLAFISVIYSSWKRLARMNCKNPTTVMLHEEGNTEDGKQKTS